MAKFGSFKFGQEKFGIGSRQGVTPEIVGTPSLTSPDKIIIVPQSISTNGVFAFKDVNSYVIPIPETVVSNEEACLGDEKYSRVDSKVKSEEHTISFKAVEKDININLAGSRFMR